MLGLIRRNANSFFIKGILALICLVFIFFFGSSALLSDQTAVIAEVDGYAIRDNVVNRQWRQQVRFQQRFNPNMTESDRQRIRQQVIDGLIERRLMTEAARSEGLVVSGAEVQQAVLTNPSFQDDQGNFDMVLYKQYLGSNEKRGASRLQESIEEDLLIDAVLDFVRSAAQVTESEVREVYAKENSKRNVEFLRVNTNSFRKDITLEEDAVVAYEEAHPAEIRERYDRDFDRLYNTPKKAKARHILKKFADDDDEAKRTGIRGQMEELLLQARGGADFAALATEHSEDSSSSRGGDLGFFDETRMVKPFSEAAFALQPGEVSEIVETQYGLHIIRLDEFQEAQVQALEEVQGEIARDLLREEKAPELAKAAAAKLVGVLDGSLDEAVADALLSERKLTVEESGDFNGKSRAIPKVGSSPEAISAAFALPSVGSVTPEPIKIPSGYVVLRLKSKTDPDMGAIETGSQPLRDRLLRTRQTRIVDAWKADLKARATIRIVPGP